MIRLLVLFMALVLATQVSAQVPVCQSGCGSCGGSYSRGCASGSCNSGSCNSGSSYKIYSQPTYSGSSYSQPVVIAPTLRLYIDDLAGGERYRSYFYARFDNGESLRLPAINGLVPSVTPVFRSGRISECYLSYGATAKPLSEVKFYDNMVWYTSTVPKQQNSNNQTVRAVGGFNATPSTTPVPNRTPLLGPSGLKAPEFDSAPKGVGLKAPEKVNINPDSEIERDLKEVNDIGNFLNKPSSTFNGNLNLGIPRY